MQAEQPATDNTDMPSQTLEPPATQRATRTGPPPSSRHRVVPKVSLILATHNRCDVVRHTLHKLNDPDALGWPRRDYEIIVVDNASRDGTGDIVDALSDLTLRRRNNTGSCAKAFGVPKARGEVIVFLDDDSYPHPGTLRRLCQHFERDPRLGAAGFAVHLPDGRQEGGALPDVFVGCGVGFRRSALMAVGGLDAGLFMQAEEYDLAFRLASAGWRVRCFDDLHVQHLKTAQARRSGRTIYYDIRNNLRVIARYLPEPAARVYARDWSQRYRWLADRDRHLAPYYTGWLTGRLLGARERHSHRRWQLPALGFERFFRWGEIGRRMSALAQTGVRRIVLAGLGKNVYPFVAGARAAGLEVLAIGDDRFTAPGRHYRGAAILDVEAALARQPQAIVVGNTAPVHAAYACQYWQTQTNLPVHDWFGHLPPGPESSGNLPL